jgi:alpha-D-ribose 1-methylphosphonate 5-triphosphate diphosphatase
MRQTLIGGTVLLGDELVADTIVAIDGDRISAIGGPVGSSEQIDARGLLVLPGLVDLHADAIERSLEPRPGGRLPLPIALAEHDGWLLANGITTCFISLTDGFEPGLRSRELISSVVSALHDPALRLAARTPLHLRREICAPGDADELVAWLAAGRIGLLSINDHLPADDDAAAQTRFVMSVRRRLNGTAANVEALVAEARARRACGTAVRDRLCCAARAHAVPLAAHDDASPAQAEASAARGVMISEFPCDLATARRARELGSAVLMGAPNAVRGGSHIGMLCASEAISAGVCDALCSDYHQPCLFHAPFTLAARGVCDLGTAWNLVSHGPAQAAGLVDRGRIRTGAMADLVLVERGPRPRVRRVWVGGREVARYA